MFKFHCSTWPFYPKQQFETHRSFRKTCVKAAVSHRRKWRHCVSPTPCSPTSARQCFICRLANRAANFEGGWLGEAGVGSRWPTHLDPTLFRTIVSCSSQNGIKGFVARIYRRTLSSRRNFFNMNVRVRSHFYIRVTHLIISLMIDIEFNIAVENMVSAYLNRVIFFIKLMDLE